MDPVTKEKIRFNPEMTEIVPKEQLDSEFGGSYHYQFDHDIYWNTLIQHCYLSPDGGRVDKNGNPTVPPLGNGAQAAAEQGTELDTTRADAKSGGALTEENGTSGQVGEEETKLQNENGDGAAVATGAVGSAGVAGGAAGATAGVTDESSASPVGDETRVGPDASVSVNESNNTVSEPVNNEPVNEPVNEQGGAGSVQQLVSSRDDIDPTAAGAPAGPVVFDHPPTSEEKREAEELMQKLNATHVSQQV